MYWWHTYWCDFILMLLIEKKWYCSCKHIVRHCRGERMLRWLQIEMSTWSVLNPNVDPFCKQLENFGSSHPIIHKLLEMFCIATQCSGKLSSYFLATYVKIINQLLWPRKIEMQGKNVIFFLMLEGIMCGVINLTIEASSDDQIAQVLWNLSFAFTSLMCLMKCECNMSQL